MVSILYFGVVLFSFLVTLDDEITDNAIPLELESTEKARNIDDNDKITEIPSR